MPLHSIVVNATGSGMLAGSLEVEVNCCQDGLAMYRRTEM